MKLADPGRPRMSEVGEERCPICQRPTAIAFRPFCSKRCADVDLGRWFSESYAVPVDDDEGDERPPDGSRGRGNPGQAGDA